MEEKEDAWWCPMGRVSIQKHVNGTMTVLQGGAFNAIDGIVETKGMVQRTLSPAFTCKSNCMFYRRGLNPWNRKGYCALSSIDYRPWLTAALAVMAVAVWLLWS